MSGFSVLDFGIPVGPSASPDATVTTTSAIANVLWVMPDKNGKLGFLGIIGDVDQNKSAYKTAKFVDGTAAHASTTLSLKFDPKDIPLTPSEQLPSVFVRPGQRVDFDDVTPKQGLYQSSGGKILLSGHTILPETQDAKGNVHYPVDLNKDGKADIKIVSIGGENVTLDPNESIAPNKDARLPIYPNPDTQPVVKSASVFNLTVHDGQYKLDGGRGLIADSEHAVIGNDTASPKPSEIKPYLGDESVTETIEPQGSIDLSYNPRQGMNTVDNAMIFVDPSKLSTSAKPAEITVDQLDGVSFGDETTRALLTPKAITKQQVAGNSNVYYSIDLNGDGHDDVIVHSKDAPGGQAATDGVNALLESQWLDLQAKK